MTFLIEKSMKIDLNCDMGESYGNFKIGNDDLVFPYITSSNIACGFHGGDPYHIEETIKKAISHGVKIGAHPGYPDLGGFGRRKMVIQPKELKAIVKYQVGAVKSLVESHGAILHYVKPHGALYNSAADNEDEALVIMKAIREIDEKLILMGLAGSLIEKLAKEKGIPFVAEAFADRKYLSTGRLKPRSQAGAVIHDAELAAEQVALIASKQMVISDEGKEVAVNAQSICIHGDNSHVAQILKSIHEKLNQENISIQPFV